MDRDTIATIFIIVIGIYILGALASISSGAAKEVALSGINALGLAGVLILAIPPIGLIIWIITLIIKSSNQPSL